MFKRLIFFLSLNLTAFSGFAFQTQTTSSILLAIPNAAQIINVNQFTVPATGEYSISFKAHAVNGGTRSGIITIQTLNNNTIIDDFNSTAIARGHRATISHTFVTELTQGDIISFKAKANRPGVSLAVSNNDPAFQVTIGTKEIKTKLP